jgi:hypothetical protein
LNIFRLALMPQAAAKIHPLKWVFISGAGFIVALVAVIAFITASGRMRLPNGLFFVILIPLGLTAAGFLFGAMRSHAVYRGESSLGKLELSGPVVVLALVVLGGMQANRAETFALTVRVHGPGGAGDIIRTGSVTADLAGVRRTSSIGASGEVVFGDVPGELDGQAVRLLIDVPKFALASGAERVTIPASHIIDLALVRPRVSTTVRGTVYDRDGRAIPDVTLNFGAGLAATHSNAAGMFSIAISVDPGTVVPLTATRHGVIVFDDNVTIAEEPALRIVIRKPGK